MLDLQPTLVGELLELRPLRPEDWSALFAVASDPLIWEQHPSPDRCQEAVFRQFFADALASGGALVAVDRATRQIIGSSRYHDFDPATRVIEIGWTFLARRYWGGRYNGEMKRLMLEHAFQAVDQVRFVIGPANHRSRRAVEKLGAVYGGPGLNAKGRESVVYLLARQPSVIPEFFEETCRQIGRSGMTHKPENYNTASPYLIVSDAGGTIAFLTRVFGAVELRKFANEAGQLLHAEVRIDDSVIMLADPAPPDWPAMPSFVHVYVDDVDATYRKALEAGATSVQEPAKKQDEDKRGGVRDAGGTTWWIATKVE